MQKDHDEIQTGIDSNKNYNKYFKRIKPIRKYVPPGDRVMSTKTDYKRNPKHKKTFDELED